MNPAKCFVIMSFKSEYDLIYHTAIKKAVEDSGLVCSRIDDDSLPKNIPNRIVSEIIDSELIIADLTETNPNVYYELGISHSVGNKTIIISQDLTRLPFDIRNEFTIGYTPTSDGTKLLYYELQQVIKQLVSHPELPSNIVQIAGHDYFDLQGQVRSNLADLVQERQRLQVFQQFLSNDRNTDNSQVILKLAKHVQQLSAIREKPAFIGVSGAAGLGKTKLADELAQVLKQVIPNSSVGILSLDSFMLDRTERLIKNLSGYDLRANDLDEAIVAIKTLEQKKSVRYFPYNHTTGKHEKTEQELEASSLIIVDGIHAFHPRLVPLLRYKIFLYAPMAVAKELRFLTDLFERSYTVHKAFEHADKEYINFEQFVLQYVKFADQVVEVDGYWAYKMSEPK